MTRAIIISIAIGIVTGFAVKHVIDRRYIEYLNTQIDVTKNIMRSIAEYALTRLILRRY